MFNNCQTAEKRFSLGHEGVDARVQVVALFKTIYSKTSTHIGYNKAIFTFILLFRLS